MKWGRWRKGDFFDGGNCLNAPGWEGRCERCGDTLRVAWLRDGATYTSYTDAGGKDRSFRKCKGGRRR